MNNYQKRINKIAKWVYLYNLECGKVQSFYKVRKWVRSATSKRQVTIYY